jgi:hypothetical protein
VYPTLQSPDSVLLCKCWISGILFRGFPCSTRFTRSGCVIQLNPMKIPSTLPAATSFSPSSAVTCPLMNSLVVLTNGRNVSRTSCWIPRNLPFSKLVPALVGNERNTDHQFPHHTHDNIVLEQYMQGRAFQLP